MSPFPRFPISISGLKRTDGKTIPKAENKAQNVVVQPGLLACFFVYFIFGFGL